MNATHPKTFEVPLEKATSKPPYTYTHMWDMNLDLPSPPPPYFVPKIEAKIKGFVDTIR